jgi:predicted Zn-dependent protease with MMP-like domain
LAIVLVLRQKSFDALSVVAMSLTLKSRATTSERSISGSAMERRLDVGLPCRNTPIEAWPVLARPQRTSLSCVYDREPQDAARDFEQIVQDALDSLPPDLREQISNVEIVVEDEPPPGQRLLGLYQGIPLTRRGTNYSGVLPDKISIYRGPLERHYGYDPELLTQNIKRVVLHEVAHHFGISDDRLIEIDRY